MDERTLRDRYGVEVFTRWWPVEAPRGVVLVAHGASEHSGRYDRFARALNTAGFACVAIDHRGHGRTASATGPGLMGSGGGIAVVDDLHEVRAAAIAEFGDDRPLFLFAHSMGSLIALAYLTRHGDGLAGAVLCGVPAAVDDLSSLAAPLEDAANAGMRDQPMTDLLRDINAPFEPGRTGYEWLSRDDDEVDRYVADPMCGDDNPLTYGYLIDLVRAVAPSREHLGVIRCPVLVIAGDHDPAAAMGAHPRTLADRLAAEGVDVRLVLYDDARHELLNETNRDDVTKDVVDWLGAHTGPPAGRR